MIDRIIKCSDASPFIEVAGVRLLNVPHMMALVNEIVTEDCYRLDEIPDGSIVFDVGAFYGEFGLICAVAKGCKVYGYEASKRNFDVLGLNYKANEDRRLVTTCQFQHVAVVGGKNEEREFFSRAHHPAGSGLSDWGDGEKENVLGISLLHEMDLTLMAELAFDDSRRVVVKLDCEGAEQEIFDEDCLGWLRWTDIITMEFHNNDGDLYAGILEAHGFKVEITGSGLPRKPWEKGFHGGLIWATKG